MQAGNLSQDAGVRPLSPAFLGCLSRLVHEEHAVQRPTKHRTGPSHPAHAPQLISGLTLSCKMPAWPSLPEATLLRSLAPRHPSSEASARPAVSLSAGHTADALIHLLAGCLPPAS